jgi:hypothetical protein
VLVGTAAEKLTFNVPGHERAVFMYYPQKKTYIFRGVVKQLAGTKKAKAASTNATPQPWIHPPGDAGVPVTKFALVV